MNPPFSSYRRCLAHFDVRLLFMGASWLLFLNFYYSLGCIEFYLLLYFFAANVVLAWCTLFISCCSLMLLLLFGCHCCFLLFICFLVWVDVAAGVYLFTTCSWLLAHAGSIRG
jgi:hypothetical protein